MKIDQKELALFIEDYPQKETTRTQRNCPSPKKLTALLRFELSGGKRKKILSHLADCSTCAKEIKFIHDLLKAEKIFDRKAAQIVKNRQSSTRKRRAARFTLPQLSWSPGVLAAAAALLILFSSLFLLLLPDKSSTERSATLQLEQITPNDITLPIEELIFQWKHIPESDYYTVEVFDDSLDLVWRSESLTENKIIPSTELKQRLKPKTMYCWMVTSFFRNGKRVESPLAKFNLE